MLTVGEMTAYLNVDDRKFNRSLDSAGRRFSGFGTRVEGVSRRIRQLAVGGLATMGTGLVFAAKAGITYLSSIEQTTIAMGTMLGSTKKAKRLIGDVAKMAAATPFEFPELADTTKRLVAYGFAQGQIIETTTRLGDISSALSIPLGELADLYGKSRVQGRLYMEDVMQFAGRGIPIYSALAKVMKVNQSEVKDLVSAGKVGFPQVEAAFKLMTEKGSMFGGMMQKQSRSFSGLWSTIKDSLIETFATAVKPLFTWLVREGMPALRDAMPAVKRAVSGALGAIAGWVSAHKEQIFGFFGKMKTFLLWGVENKGVVVAAFSAIWGAVGGPVQKLLALVGVLEGVRMELEKIAGVTAPDRLEEALTGGWGKTGGPWNQASKDLLQLKKSLIGFYQIKTTDLTSLEKARTAIAKIAAARKTFAELRAADIFSKDEEALIEQRLDKMEGNARRTFANLADGATDAGTRGSKGMRKPFVPDIRTGKVKIPDPTAEAEAARQRVANILRRTLGMSIALSFNLGSGAGGEGGLGGLGGIAGGMRAVSFAKAQLGDSYQVGATGPEAWDCSGLMMGAYRAAGLRNFPTYTGNQWVLGRQVSKGSLLPGDQIFMRTNNPMYTDAFGWGHTGIYIGGGQMIHAAGSRSGVITSPVGGGYPWAARRHFAAAGADFMTDGPTLLLAGEAGRERVKVTPAPVDGASSGMTVNFNGDLIGVDATDLAHQVVALIGREQRRYARGVA